MNPAEQEPKPWSCFSAGVTAFSAEPPDRVCFELYCSTQRIAMMARDAYRCFGDPGEGRRHFGEINPDYVISGIAMGLPADLDFRHEEAVAEINLGEPIGVDLSGRRQNTPHLKVAVQRKDGECRLVDIVPIWKDE